MRDIQSTSDQINELLRIYWPLGRESAKACAAEKLGEPIRRDLLELFGRAGLADAYRRVLSDWEDRAADLKIARGLRDSGDGGSQVGDASLEESLRKEVRGLVYSIEDGELRDEVVAKFQELDAVALQVEQQVIANFQRSKEKILLESAWTTWRPWTVGLVASVLALGVSHEWIMLCVGPVVLAYEIRMRALKIHLALQAVEREEEGALVAYQQAKQRIQRAAIFWRA